MSNPTTPFVVPNMTPGVVVVAWYDGDQDWTLYPIHAWRIDLAPNVWDPALPANPILSVDLPDRWLIHDVNSRRSWIPGDVEFDDIADARRYLRSGRLHRAA